ncbi:MAG: hypothetical protein QOK43_1712 [Acidimicrobiaceae bacterium]|nr:hypothetical protein [Acidimicrobiaceae bacterium]
MLLALPVVPAGASLDDPYCRQIDGSLVDLFNRPLPNVYVEVHSANDYCHSGADTPQAQTDAAGHYIIFARALLPTDTVQIEVSPSDTFYAGMGAASPAPLPTKPNVLTAYYLVRPQTWSQAVRSGGSINLNAYGLVPRPTDDPAGTVVAEVPGGSLINLAPPAGDSRTTPWVGSLSTTQAAEGFYSFYVCAPRASYAGRCSTATQADLLSAVPVQRGYYAVDNTSPTVSQDTWVPSDGGATAYVSQPIMVKVADALSGVDATKSSFVLEDVTAGTSRTISGSAVSYANGWLKTTAQALVDGHLYRASVTAVDRTGNTATAAMKAPEEGGGFLVTHQSAQPTQASISMTDCSLSPVTPGATTRSATCSNVPLHLDASSVVLGGSRQEGAGFLDQVVSLGALRVTTLQQRALAQNAFSSAPAPRKQPVRFAVSPFQGDRALSAPAFDGVLPGGPITLQVPAVWTDTQIFLDPAMTTASTETCADPSGSTKATTCLPDPVSRDYVFTVRDTTDVAGTANAETAGTGCTVNAVLDESYLATCPLADLLTLATDPRNASSQPLLPETPTVNDPSFDPQLEQLIQDQAAAVGDRFGGASWETGGLVTFRLTAGDVPAALQSNAKIRVQQVQFAISALDAAMDTVANRLNPLLAPGIAPGRSGDAWPWEAAVDVDVNKVVVAIGPAQAPNDSAIRNSLADLVTAGTVAPITYQPVLPLAVDESTSCLSQDDCTSPVRAGVAIVRPVGGNAAALCTSAFTMVDGLGVRHVSTAGHCGGGTWRHHGSDIGNTTWIRNSGNIDFQAFRANNDTSKTPENYLYRPGDHNLRIDKEIIKPSATKGNEVCGVGAVGGQQCGKMETHNASFNGQPGYGKMSAAETCHGDSGGPVFNASNNRAYGFHKGGTGANGATCTTGDVKRYFTWVLEVEKASGYHVLLGPASATLGSGQRMYCGDYLRSNNGRYSLVMQCDGNLVAYETGEYGSTSFWSSGTHCCDLSGYSAVMQNDGILVIYSPTGTAKWARGCCAAGTRLTLQDDRNIVMYRPDGSAAWASGTNVNY